MPRRTVRVERTLRTSVPPDATDLLAFVNVDAEMEMAGDERSVRTELREHLSRIARAQHLPPGTIRQTYALDTKLVGNDHRSALDWFKYRRGLEWIATQGPHLLRECPRCQSFFVLPPTSRRTRKFCDACAR